LFVASTLRFAAAHNRSPILLADFQQPVAEDVAAFNAMLREKNIPNIILKSLDNAGADRSALEGITQPLYLSR